jgi:hypothetical protein
MIPDCLSLQFAGFSGFKAMAETDHTGVLEWHIQVRIFICGEEPKLI